jgi:biotin operon repressor
MTRNRLTDRIVAALQAANGGFIEGPALAEALGINPRHLPARMVATRQHYPNLVIEGRQHRGYRIVSGSVPDAPAPAATKAVSIATIAPDKPGGAAIPLHRRMAANLAILDLLPAKTAEQVKRAAMDAGEDIDATMHRLISYGIEVHTDLVVHGENPVGLRRPKAEARAQQVLQ